MGNLRTIDHGTELVWSSESDQLKADASYHFDAEYLEHDAALGVFKSPRPSYTLDELSKHTIRFRLLKEQREPHLDGTSNSQGLDASVIETFHGEDNPWEPEQRGGGIAGLEDAFDGPYECGIEEDSEDDTDERENLSLSDGVLIRASEGEIRWEDGSDDEEEDADQGNNTALLDMSALSGALGEEHNAWEELRREAARPLGEEDE